MSAHMADPPASAISSAATMGAASRTTARTIAAPVSATRPELASDVADLQRDRPPKAIETARRGSSRRSR